MPELTRRTRWLLAALGLASVVCAVVASFRNHEGSTPTAIAVFGAIALLLSVIGTLPRRVQVGDNAIEFAVEKAVDTTVSTLGPDAIEAIVSALAATADQSGTTALVTRRASEHLTFHQAVVGVIRQVVEEMGEVSVTVGPSIGAGAQVWDAAIEQDGGNRVLVEAVLRLDSQSGLVIGERVKSLGDDHTSVLVVYQDMADGAAEALAPVGVVALFAWSGGADALAKMLRRLLNA